MFACHFRIEVVHLPVVGNLSMGIFSLPVTVVWIVGVINAINLIDGLDGLAAGVVFFAGLTNFIVAYLGNQIMVALLMSSMLGAVLGFLFYNFNPARIFMGDSGSYFLGFVLATTSLLGSMQGTSTAVSILVPILALGVPIFDTLFAIVRRFLERRPLFSPDRGHVHHRLLDMGITHRRAVLILYGFSVVLTVAAMGVSLGKSWQAGIAIFCASVVLIGLIRFAGYFEYLHGLRRQKARLRSRDAERLRRVVPDAVVLLARTQNEQELWEVFHGLMERAEMAAVEVLEPPLSKAAPALAWVTRERSHPTELVTARYPLGRDDNARAALKFRWESDFGDVSPQCEVLLQVLVDIVAQELTRHESRLGPMVAPDDQDARVRASARLKALHAASGEFSTERVSTT
jgi:UDP-GlcNAc:undecaprenyl-phosphate GlcNAc-1-phosphate transferase